MCLYYVLQRCVFVFILQSYANDSTASKSSKPKKLNCRRLKKSPLRTVDDQTGPLVAGEARTAALSAAMAISGTSNRNLFGQSTRGSGSRSAPTSPVATNSNVIPPPPNATVVVCVLAGTGRADLWVRNNRGQTPLDLCPADQPLRRALIKCCDAAARARSAQAAATAAAAAKSGASSSATTEPWPQKSQLNLFNIAPDYSITAPYQDAYLPLIDGVYDGELKECNKRPHICGLPDFFTEQMGYFDELLTSGVRRSSNSRTAPARVAPDNIILNAASAAFREQAAANTDDDESPLDRVQNINIDLDISIDSMGVISCNNRNRYDISWLL